MVSLSRLFALACLGLVAGCATGPAAYNESDTVRTAFMALETADPAVQVSRFGVYAKAAGNNYLGVRSDDGETVAFWYRWAIPGVVLEELSHMPHHTHLAFQHDPGSGMLDVFNMGTSSGLPTHIRVLKVLPEGTVEWPEALLGLEPPSRVKLEADGSLVRSFVGYPLEIVGREVAAHEYNAALKAAHLREFVAEQESMGRSAEFLNGMSRALGAATAELRDEHEARQLREAHERSALMRQQAAEMRAMDRRLADQRRNEQQRQAEASARQRAESNARQQAERTARRKTTGDITLGDSLEREREFRRQEATRQARMTADEAASNRELRKLQAQTDARAAARVAEARRQKAEADAINERRKATCAATGRDCAGRVSAQ